MKKYLEEMEELVKKLEAINPVTDANIGELMSLLMRAEKIKKELIHD
jgi:hypothetical protein